MTERLSSIRPRTLLIGALVTVVLGTMLFAVWPLPRVEELGGGPILDTRFAGSGSDAEAYLTALGGEGRRLYGILAVGDLLWAVVHGLTVAAATAVAFTRSRLPSGLAVSSATAVGYLVFDVLENSSVLAAIARHPRDLPVPASVMDLLTSLKFLALGAAYVALVIALVAWSITPRSEPATSPHRT